MAWSSGTFTRLWSWVTDSVTYPNMLASRFDTYLTDMATGINTCLTKDGQNAATANLPMGGYIHTNVGNATARTNYPNVGQIQDGSLVTSTDTGSADAYVVTLNPAPTTYATGMTIWLKIANTNTGVSTLNVNSIGAKTIKNGGTTDVSAGDLTAGKTYAFYYDGTNFQVVGIGGSVADGSITTAKLASNAVTLAKMATGTANRLLGFNGSGAVAETSVAARLTHSSSTLDMATSGVTAGSYTASNITVDAYGRVTAAANGSSSTTYEQAVKTDKFSTTSTSFTSVTGLSKAITPSSTSKKVAVLVTLNGCSSNLSAFRVTRGGTAIAVGDAAGSRTQASFSGVYGNGDSNSHRTVGFFYIDSPSTTSSTTYAVEAKCETGTLTVNSSVNDPDNSTQGYRTTSTITVWEV